MSSHADSAAQEIVDAFFPGDARKEFMALVRASALSSAMAESRFAKGLTQRQLAKKMGCSAAKVCSMESAMDCDLRLGDVAKYFAALGMETSIGFNDPGLPAAKQIKNAVFTIKDKLDDLAGLAMKVDDKAIADDIHRFYAEVLFNFLAKFEDSHRRLRASISPPSDIRLGPAEAERSHRRCSARTPHRRRADAIASGT